MRQLAAFLVSLLAAAALTPLVMLLARRHGMVAQPKADRWHRQPTALFGGVAIALAFLLPAALLTRGYHPGIRLRIAGLLLGAALMFFVGMLDDLLHLKPSSKLIGQIIAACLLVWCGVYFNILDMPLVTIPLTIFWVVGITNAFNLLDNMDGLSAGVAAIAALTLFALNSVLGIDSSIGVVALSFAGALLGFLVYNFNPARIFMGDCGSMMIGFTLAGLSIAGTWQQASNVFFILAVPVLTLGVPIFDTAFVTVTRRLRGQPVSVGGRDHTSHRLVALGLSERRAVLLLYGICLAFGALAVLSLRYDAAIIGTAAALSAIVLVVFGMFLGQDRLYRDVTPGRAGAYRERLAGREPGFVFGTFIMHKRRIVEVLLDLVVFGLSFVVAWLLRFEGVLDPAHEPRFLFALPILIVIKLLTFWSFGMYRRLWAFTGVHDLVILARAVLTSTLLSVFTLWGLTRLEHYSRALFVLDGLLLLVFAAGTRILFRVFQETLTTDLEEGRRLLIVGAGQAGEILLREVRRDRGLGYNPIGFVDDDRDKQGRRLHGVRILGGREHILKLAVEEAFDEIVIAIPSLDTEERDELVHLCRATGKPTRVMQPVSTTFLQ